MVQLLKIVEIVHAITTYNSLKTENFRATIVCAPMTRFLMFVVLLLAVFREHKTYVSFYQQIIFPFNI